MYPILKSRGVWFDGNLALSRQQLAELGYGPETNPFHIDPTTGKPFDSTLYKLRDPQTALMEELAKKFVEAGRTRDWGSAKMMAKALMNRASDKHNRRKLEKYGAGAVNNLLPKRWREDGSLDPEYHETHYSERWQKHPRPHKDTGEFIMEGRGAPKVHPADRVVRDKKGNLTTFSLSSVPDPHLGEFIEGSEIHDYSDLIHECRQEGIHFPYDRTKGGVGHPELMARGAWRKDHKTQNPTDPFAGTGLPQEGEHYHTGPNGEGFDLISSILSLDSRYWEPRGIRNIDRKLPILNNLFMGRLNEDLLRKIAKCAIGEWLVAEHDRPANYEGDLRDYRPARGKHSPFRSITNEILHNNLDTTHPTTREPRPGISIPTNEQGAAETGTDPWKIRTTFDSNAGHMKMHLGSRGGEVTHKFGGRIMAQAVLASLMLRDKKRRPTSSLAREFRNHFPGYTPFKLGVDIEPMEYHDGMRGANIPEEPAAEAPARVGGAEFGPAGGVTPGQEVTVHGPGEVVGDSGRRVFQGDVQKPGGGAFQLSMDKVLDKIYSDIIKHSRV